MEMDIRTSLLPSTEGPAVSLILSPFFLPTLLSLSSNTHCVKHELQNFLGMKVWGFPELPYSSTSIFWNTWREKAAVEANGTKNLHPQLFKEARVVIWDPKESQCACSSEPLPGNLNRRDHCTNRQGLHPGTLQGVERAWPLTGSLLRCMKGCLQVRTIELPSVSGAGAQPQRLK